MNCFSFKIVVRAALLNLLLISTQVVADVSVIVHPANTNVVSEQDIAQIYLGAKKSFADGRPVEALDREEGSAIRTSFTKRVLNRSERQLKSYWSRRVFTGKGLPPRVVANDEDVKSMVAENPEMIGYIDSNLVDQSVRVVYTY